MNKNLDLFDLWKILLIMITAIGGVLGFLWTKNTQFHIVIRLFMSIWLSVAFFYFYIQFWRFVIYVWEIKEKNTIS